MAAGIAERTLDRAAGDAQAARMRQAGASYAQIAESLGYASSGGAHAAVKRALKEAVREPATELLQHELDRLDTMWSQVVGIAYSSRSEPEVRLKAVDRLLRIMERRSKLLGLDAPVKVEHRITDAVDAQLEALAAEVAALSGDDATLVEA